MFEARVEGLKGESYDLNASSNFALYKASEGWGGSWVQGRAQNRSGSRSASL